jgi:acetyl-CoA synthetase
MPSRCRRSIETRRGSTARSRRSCTGSSPGSRWSSSSRPTRVWFVGATTNLCYNCVDRHVEAGRGDAIGLIWEGEPVENGTPEIATFTYAELQSEVARFANALKGLGVREGRRRDDLHGHGARARDRVPRVRADRRGPQRDLRRVRVAAIVDRVRNASSKVIVTCDGAWRRGKVVPLKANVDEACAGAGRACRAPVCLKRTNNEIGWTDGRDAGGTTRSGRRATTAPASRSTARTGVPALHLGLDRQAQGHQAHRGRVHGARLPDEQVRLQHDPRAGRAEAGGDGTTLPDGQVYWCTADVGWITGHSYIVYGVDGQRRADADVRGRAQLPGR